MGAMIAIAVTGLFLTMVTAGVLTANQIVPAGGEITAIGVGVYTDSDCTNNCTNIDWGTLAPGNSTDRTIYVKNTGSIPVTLSMTATGWTPSDANTYLTLTWNQEGHSLDAGDSVAATLTLTASTSAGNLTSFNFNVVITGTQ